MRLYCSTEQRLGSPSRTAAINRTLEDSEIDWSDDMLRHSSGDGGRGRGPVVDWERGFYTLKGRTASGGHATKFTAAHRSLPLGSKVRVTNLRNNRSVVVTITVRGPFTGGRVIDVSKKAAKALHFRSKGVAPVRVDVVAN